MRQQNMIVATTYAKDGGSPIVHRFGLGDLIPTMESFRRTSRQAHELHDGSMLFVKDDGICTVVHVETEPER